MLQFTPINNLLKSRYFAYVYLVVNAYIMRLAIFAIIENYERIKSAIGQGQSRVTNFLDFESENPKIDLLRFILIAIAISFCIDVILTKLTEQPFFDYLTKYIPGLDEFKRLTEVDIAKNFNSTIAKSQNITGYVDNRPNRVHEFKNR